MLRMLVRSLVVAGLGATVLVGIGPGPLSVSAAPRTVLRSVDLPVRELVPARPRSALRATADGRLRASRATTTPSARVCSPIWFTALGVTWDQQGDDPIEIDVATSEGGRTYGRTRTLDAESGADPGSAEFARGESASTLLWTPGGRCARIAFELSGPTSISNVAVHFLNASGSAAGKGTGPGDVDVGSGLLAPSSADAATRQPNFISRQQWGADPRLMNCTPDVAPAVKMGFVHHTAGTNNYSRAQSDDIVRAIYAYHTRGRGWCDIAYNFLIDKYGRVFEGRSGGITNPVVGAATQGFNTGSFSVALMGTYSSTKPRTPMMNRLKRVLAWRLDVAHVKPTSRVTMVSSGGDNTRYNAGTKVDLPAIALHRTTGYTDCPGNKVARRIGGIRDAVAKIGLPKIYAPRLTPNVVDVGSPDIRIRAGASGNLTWSVSVLDPDGNVIFSFNDRTGNALDLTWVEIPAHPYPREHGRYWIRIAGERADGTRARAAQLPFTVRPLAL